MPYDVTLEARALKRLRKLPKDIIADAAKALKGLRENPRPRGCRKIRGKDNAWRIVLREDYRVLYQVFDDQQRVLVYDVGRREKDTYN
jgi:mRNA interferase RelE/StbE